MSQARRRQLLIAAGALLAVRDVSPQSAKGQLPKVGVFHWGSADDGRVLAFRQSLRALGYVEGRNVAVDIRATKASYQTAAELVAELIRNKANVLVIYSTPATRAAAQATTTLPIVTISADPVANGLVASLARPGGNITGVSLVGPEADAKALELLKATVPGLRSVAFRVGSDQFSHYSQIACHRGGGTGSWACRSSPRKCEWQASWRTLCSWPWASGPVRFSCPPRWRPPIGSKS